MIPTEFKVTPSPTRTSALRRRQLQRAGIPLAMTLSFATTLVMKLGPGPTVVLVGTVVFVSIVAIGFSVVTQHRISLFCSTSQFGRVDRFGRRHAYPLSDIASLHQITLRSARLGSRPVLVVLGRNGRSLVSVRNDAREPGDLQRFISCLGLPLTEHTKELTVPHMAQLFPGVVPGWARHPNVTGAVVALVAIFVISAIAILTGHGAHAGSPSH